jgi:hypothetical protein
MDELEALLRNADFAVGALYRTHAPALRPLLGAMAQVFEQQLRSYDYPNALECLRAVRATLIRREPA